MKDCILSTKELLIGYVSTLSDDKCKRAYKLLTAEFDIDTSKFIRYNENMEQDLDGLVRLKKSQMTRLMKTQGEFKLKWMVKVLHNWIYELKARSLNGDIEARKKFRNYDTSCYDKLMRGWLQEKFARECKEVPSFKPAKEFYELTTEAEALQYAKDIPLDFAIDSPELTFLASKFNSVNKYIRSLRD